MNETSHPQTDSSAIESSDEGESDPSSPDPPLEAPVSGMSDDDPVIHEPYTAIAWHCPIDESIDAWLIEQFAAVGALVGVDLSRVSLAVVSDPEMAQMHEQYKNVSGTTDVLTFDLRDEADEPVEGDIVLCFDEASRQAAARGHALSHELLLYAVHGLLHLLGYDDHNADDAAAMHAREDELLKQIGLQPVYANGEAS